MTQIISAITERYAVLAADRRLTFLNGPNPGAIADDDTCKLVSLCNVCGIGYSGLARIENKPTHEWIATVLALHNCSHPSLAAQILAEESGRALSTHPPSLRRQIFTITGWCSFQGLDGLRPFICAVSNFLDEKGTGLPLGREVFDWRVHPLQDGERLWWRCFGEPLSTRRHRQVDRNLRKLASRGIGPKGMLRLIVDEIVHSSLKERRATVGSKVLAMCIPKQSVERQVAVGMSLLLAKQPDEGSASFAYFDPSYSEFEQYGPAFVCGGSAWTDLKTENDPSTGSQSSEMKFLGGGPRPKT